MTSFVASKPQSWRLTADSANAVQEHFLCSNDPSLIQLDALHEAMSSEVLWWATPLTPDALAAVVTTSVCLGVYHQTSTSEEAGLGPMIGFARLITDRATFAYLTDVYILPAYQRRGLGTWLMRCLRDMLMGDGEVAAKPGWKNLRSLWLVASTPAAARMYETTLKAHTVARYRAIPGKPDSGMIMLEMSGPGNAFERKKNGQRQHAVVEA
ncbi:gcn5-related n-acetyltransferase [Grosmannia clavigera kw1407]|uniref:Gcn5-related n-acetyltransferase n=1 Tax=Grosmannia clavigera (strain kw1407 / UAMH 11150) TaxID=655863 RepID=F0X912_GROCL|nr:gcn5-related n-acetyltransferase [Grosmannia clavigera kw1407]EFX05202.1 gcn5-related n-acetyltransferase [Grosmannia clavigera kw1407]